MAPSDLLCKSTALPLHVPLLQPPTRKPLFRIVHCSSSASPRSSRDASSPSSPTSYLDMWKRAKERYEEENLKRQLQNLPQQQQGDWQEKERTFSRILQVSPEDRDRVQRMQVVDRAAAALAAAQALLAEQPSFRNSAATLPESYLQSVSDHKKKSMESPMSDLTKVHGFEEGGSSAPWSSTTLKAHATPGPDFWTWSPPQVDESVPKLKTQALPSKSLPVVLEKKVANASLTIPYESTKEAKESKNQELLSMLQSRAKPSLPPLQSLLEVQKEEVTASEEVAANIDVFVPDIGSEVAAVVENRESSAFTTDGVSKDGSRWWKETGTEERANGVLCTWTVIRGVNANGTEWEEKFWEAVDEFDYKELGAEKSGRDAYGNVWREFWKESMWQDLQTGLLHMEKSADKWAKNGYGGEWHEKWWEHYDASGHAEKWADKWSKIDPTTPLAAGHAHVWHERWGEKFDGQGAAVKYTDKWAERAEFGGAWSKWGDKWDEHFDNYGHGVKQGETWWQGERGERWNRTWGEQHNGTGWVHKYGQSSSGEHWDTHMQQDTWYETQPHFGLHHCLENSQELQRVGRKNPKS